MRILATGGAGYVGSAVVRQLHQQGHQVWAYDNLSKGHQQSVPPDCLTVGQLSDQQNLVQVLREKQIDAVMHFAAWIAVGESVEKPSEYYQNNIANSLILLQAMLQADVKRILFSSTAAVYAPIEQGALDEDSPKAPASPYAFSKYAIERMIEDFSHAYGLGFTILRYFNACGASPDGQYGEAHDPETHLIPLVLQVPLGQREYIGVFGNDYPTPDKTCVRDYVHVDDLAQAHIRAVEALEPGQKNRYNIGTGTGHSVLEVIQAAQEVTGRKIDYRFLPPRPGDTARLVAGSRKIQNELGWKMNYTQLKDIIETAWTWHKSHPTGYK